MRHAKLSVTPTTTSYLTSDHGSIGSILTKSSVASMEGWGAASLAALEGRDAAGGRGSGRGRGGGVMRGTAKDSRDRKRGKQVA